MSKKAKEQSKDRRRKEKSMRKAGERAKWESFMKAGTNGKSKRAKLKAAADKHLKMRPKTHPVGECFNYGCPKCYKSAKPTDYSVSGLLKFWAYNK